MFKLLNLYHICDGLYKVPVFVAEIAPKELRGTLTTLNQVDLLNNDCNFGIIGVRIYVRVHVFVAN